MRKGWVLGLCLLAGVGWGANAGHWPQFRGPGAGGIADGAAPPTDWDVESGKNILWKTPLPGLGFSSPVIWGDRIYLTTAVSGKEDPELKVGLYGQIAPVEDDSVHQFLVVAVDRSSGEVVWQQLAHEGVPEIKRHTKASHANSTVATNGDRVVAFFGSEGLFCYDRDGELLWKRDFGTLDSGFFMAPTAQWGFASSPVIHDDKVVIQVDVQQNSFVAALNLNTGETLWKTERKDVPTWSTPAVHTVTGRGQVIVNGWKHAGAYDLETGEEVWKIKGGGDIPVPTPVIGRGLVFLTNAHGPGSPVYAVREGASGDISLEEDTTANDGIVWSVPRGGAYMQTPVLYDDLLYVCRDNGVLSVFDAGSGERLYQERIGDGTSGYTASAVAADGHLFYTSEVGDVTVIKHGRTFEKVAEATVDEIVMATPAIAEGTLYVRARYHLLAIGAAASEDADGADEAADAPSD